MKTVNKNGLPISLVLLLFGLTLFPFATCYTQPPGLVGYWNLDQGSGTIAIDSSGYNNQGTIYGASWTSGKINGALNFDGVDDYVDCGNSATLDPTQGATIEACVYFSKLPSVAGHIMAIAGKSGSGTDLDMQAEPDNRFKFFIGPGVVVVSNTVAEVGKWYHIVGTYEAANNLKIYVNGVLEKTTLTSVTRGTNPNKFCIGQSGYWGGRFFNGIIDEVKIFNRALSAEEVKSEYFSTEELSLKGSRSWYWTSRTEINSLARGDVDGDSQQEIVTGGYYWDGTRSSAQLCVWNGATLALENIKTWCWTNSTFIFSVAVGDVDGDAQTEIVTGGNYYVDVEVAVAQLCVWNGATLALENVRTWYWGGETGINSVAVGDVDSDAQTEIVTGGSYYDIRYVAQLCVWNGATLALENVRTWYWTSNTHIKSVAVADVDGDAQTEIVTGGSYYDSRYVAQLCVWNGATLTLENVRTWYWTGSTDIHSVAVGDVDGDGSMEIVTGGFYSDGARYNAQQCVWSGTSLTLEKAKTWYWTSYTEINSVAVADVDGDAQTEIVTGGYYYDGTNYNAQLCVWNGVTFGLQGVKTWHWGSTTRITSVAIGDVDGDGKTEIVTGGYFYDGTRDVAQLTVWS